MDNDARSPTAHRFCWADLATVDDSRARTFYSGLFDWTARSRGAGQARYSTLETQGSMLASVYRLSRAQIERGVPSHWLAYVSTADLNSTLDRAVALGAEVLVTPQDYPGLARIAVVVDPTGALLGLWQSNALETSNAVRTAFDGPAQRPAEGNR